MKIGWYIKWERIKEGTKRVRMMQRKNGKEEFNKEI